MKISIGKIIPSILIFCFVGFHGMAQTLRINEVMSSNSNYLDEDGDTPDWIELYNSTEDAINLQGYFISDRLDKPSKWEFPYLDINADDFLLIWASKKDRDYSLAWRGLIDEGDEFRYILPNQPVDQDWTELSFDDSSWDTGRSGFGYGDGDDRTQIPAGTRSVYIRKKFNIEKVESASSVLLHIDYDDAFVAYINGVEIARANIEGFPPSYNEGTITDHEAVLYENGYPEGFFSNNLSDFLVEGENVLTIQGHNISENSSDFSLIPFLSVSFIEPNDSGEEVNSLLGLNDSNLHTNFKITSEGETIYLFDPDTLLVDSLLIPALNPDVTYGVNHQTGELEYYETPTPKEENSSISYQGQLDDEIIFSHESGLVDQIALTMSTDDNNKTIRYTLDSTEPDENSTEYIQAISILSTSIVRARVFEENFIPSKTQTRSFIINTNHQLPVISLVTEPDNFFDTQSGIYVLGPNDYDQSFPFFGSNFWEDWERPINFSLFEADGSDGFSMDAGVKIFGGWSRAHEQRSLSLFARNQYGYQEIDYPIFENRPYEEYQALVFRNSGNDWLNSNIRDGILTSLMEGSGLETQAFRPAVCYFNGEYWGIYNIREKANEHLPSAKFSTDPDSTRVLELDGVNSDGEIDEEYLEFITYVNDNNLFNSTPYNFVSEQMDIENFIIYNVTQIYVNNTDWPGNNIKFWKSPETKWRWILFDTDFGFGVWNQFDFANNTLDFALEQNGNTWPNPPWSTLLFRKLMQNNGFKNQFVNRFADELNTRFLPANVNAHIDSVSAIVTSEIQDHYERWGGDPGSHYQAIANMRNFANQRPLRVKNHILQTLDLPEHHQITFRIDDIEKGYIHLNSLTLREAQWSGDYFEEVPINVQAIANEGYTFSHWSGSISSTEASQTIDMQADMNITANFTINTSTEDKPELTGVKLYPNPTSSMINLEFETQLHGNLEIKILDYRGALVRTLLHEDNYPGQKLLHFELGGIPQGSYSLVVSNETYKELALEFIVVE